jgi:hypothetical protein
LLAEFQFEQRFPSLSGKSERRRQGKKVLQLRPDLSYELIRTLFSNHLHQQNVASYRVEELEAFVAKMAN